VAPTSTSRRRSRAAVNDKPFDAGGVEDAGQGLGVVVDGSEEILVEVL